MWETLCRGYSVNLQCEDSSCLPCGWSIAWFPQIHADFHRFYMIDKNRNPPLVFFVAALTHKNQNKPLAVDANVSASHGWRSRLEILEQAQIFSACYTITLRVSHQPQGDKQEINIISVAYWKTIKNMLRPA